MITLDKIRIKMPLSFLGANPKRCEIKAPFYLKITYIENYAYITFTSKILLEDYPSMINKDNIDICLERVKEIAQIDLDIECILNEGEVVSCDFTKDICINDIDGINNDFSRIKNIIQLTIPNNQLYSCSLYRNGSFYVNKSVNTKKLRYRITFYNKEKEIRLKRNREFLSMLDNREDVLSYFDNKLRVEANAFTSTQIKRWLRIEQTSIHDVLNSEENPLRNSIQEVFLPINISETKISQRAQDRLSLLKGLNWNMCAVEANVREHESQNWKRALEPYRELCALYSPYFNDIRHLDISEWV